MALSVAELLFGVNTKRFPDTSFWEDERERLFELLTPLIGKAAVEGAKSALTDLEEIGIGVDWRLVNEAVKKWAEEYTYDLVKGITETSKNFLQQELSEWIGSGEPLPVLLKKLEPMWGPVRAEMIGVTETTRAFAEGNLATWRESGIVEGKRWMTGEDELVCEICAPLDGMEVALDDETGFDGISAPPAHVRCRCYLQPVVLTIPAFNPKEDKAYELGVNSFQYGDILPDLKGEAFQVNDVRVLPGQVRYIAREHPEDFRWINTRLSMVRKAIERPDFIEMTPRSLKSGLTMAHVVSVAHREGEPPYLVVVIQLRDSRRSNQLHAIYNIFRAGERYLYDESGQLRQRWIGTKKAGKTRLMVPSTVRHVGILTSLEDVGDDILPQNHFYDTKNDGQSQA